MPMRRSVSMNDTFRRRSNSVRREAGRMSATEMGAGMVKAIRCGDEAWLSALLAAGAPPNARDEAGRPLLYLLFESGSGSPDVCKMLLQRGALPDLPVPGTGQTALHAAARKGFQVCIGQLLSESTKPDLPDALGNTPLIYACANGHDPSARMLIKAGAYAGKVNRRGETGLHLAVKHGSLGCVKEMLAVGCPVNGADETGLTPLLSASITNETDIIHLLLDHASSVNEQDPSTGRTPLHWAVLHRDQSTVTRLLRLGADPDLRDADWNTAFLIAVNLSDRQMARLLVEAGSDVSVTDKSFNTALHLTSRDGYEELIPIFVESGLDLDLKGPGGLTPLMLGAFGGHEKVVRALLAFGASPNLLDRNRASALVYAMLSNAAPESVRNIVKCLVQFNADLDESANLIGLSRGLRLPPEVTDAAVADRLYSPIEVACLRGNACLCAMLIRADCDLSVFSAPRSSSRASGRSPTVVNRDLLQKLVQCARRQRRTVPALLELCRRPALKGISQFTSLARLEELELPEGLKRFLRYEDLDVTLRPTSATVPCAEAVGRTLQGAMRNQSRNAVVETAGTLLGPQRNRSRSRMEPVAEPRGTPLRPQAFHRNDQRRRTIAEVPRSGTGSSRLNLHRKSGEFFDLQDQQNLQMNSRVNHHYRKSTARTESPDQKNPRNQLQVNHCQNSTGTSTSGSSGSGTPRSFSTTESSSRSSKPRPPDRVIRATTSAQRTLSASRVKSSSNLSRPEPLSAGSNLSSRVRTPLKSRSSQV